MSNKDLINKARARNLTTLGFDNRNDVKSDTTSSPNRHSQPTKSPTTSDSAPPTHLTTTDYATCFPSLPPSKPPASITIKPTNSVQNHTRKPFSETDYDTIDPGKDTELAEEGVLIGENDAEEGFELVPRAKKLSHGNELEGNGKPFAGQRAWDDAVREREGEEEGNGGEVGQAKAKKKGGNWFWSKEGKAEDAGGK
ncbi:hypothetical protein DOTSEDRAFT_24922 [Dothistroma septosporum NZE10]|uniref:Uncharacterized protein n=1 Tax=Dothistroma septosporum (strain NZE10 / CBS 128990) TaxID=675120 RepID=M2WLM5_DOTSN|nr:hypothetical protein DOTSEDRAFT_24922 [Dothistroma septosporum NZE10]